MDNDENEEKVKDCPISRGVVSCIRDDCGWWMTDKCAVLAIADILPTVLADLVTAPAEDPRMDDIERRLKGIEETLEDGC